MKQKAFYIPTAVDSTPLKELNELLEKGWTVHIHDTPSAGWLAIAREPGDKSGGQGAVNVPSRSRPL